MVNMVLRHLKTGAILGASIEQPELRPLPHVPGGEIVNLRGWPVDWYGRIHLPKPRPAWELALRRLLRYP